MAEQNNASNGQQSFSNPLLQRFFLSPAEREDKANGKQIVKAFYNQQTVNDTNFNIYLGRNRRWIETLLWAKGSQPMQEFLDYMSVSDANKSYVNIDMTQQRVAVELLNTLIEFLSKHRIYPDVDAIDSGSMSEKEQRLFDALYRMYDQQNIQKMQQAAGIALEPPNAYIPQDEMSAKIYFEMEDRLPKVIRFQEMLEKIMEDIKFDKELNRKGLYDLTTLNIEVTKIEKIAPKQYTVRKAIPTNVLYNFFMNDSGQKEVDLIGEFYNVKVRDFRAKFGKSEMNPDGLNEQQIYDLAKMSSMKNIGKFSWTWENNYANPTWNQNRPYDDCSILVLDCEINCGEDVYSVVKKDAYGKPNIEEKKGIPYQVKTKDGSYLQQEKPEDVEIKKGQKNSWMRGIYAPYGDIMIYWGRPDLIICPYTDVYNPLSSWSIVIPNNDGEYVPSHFERILEPLREYTITKLKRKQLIAQLRPSGIRIDVESARNIDLGNGNTIEWEEVLRIFNQTGTEVWSSKGLDPLEKTMPSIGNTAADDAVQKVMALSNIMASQVGEMRSLLGTSVFLEGGDVGERTAARLQENQLEQAPNVFGYLLNSHNQVWEETFYKLCLLKWNDIVKDEPESREDLLDTRFDVKIRMESSEYQKKLLEDDIQRYSQVPDAIGNPSLTLKDAMMLREIQDPKLARWYLTTTYEENRRKASEEARAREEANAKSQQQSLLIKAQEDAKAAQEQLLFDAKLKEAESKEKKEQILLQGIMDLYKNGIAIPASLIPLEKDVMQSVHMSLFLENKQTEQAIDEGIMQAQQDNAQMEQQQQQAQQQPMQQTAA